MTPTEKDLLAALESLLLAVTVGNRLEQQIAIDAANDLIAKVKPT